MPRRYLFAFTVQVMGAFRLANFLNLICLDLTHEVCHKRNGHISGTITGVCSQIPFQKGRCAGNQTESYKIVSLVKMVEIYHIYIQSP